VQQIKPSFDLVNAHHTLTLWHKLDAMIKNPEEDHDVSGTGMLPDSELKDNLEIGKLKTPQEYLAKAAEFPAWLTANSEEIKKMRAIDLSQYPIRMIPSEIFHLTHLTSLVVFDSNIEFLSPAITQLTNLDTLEFQNTAIPQLPSAISHMTNLTNLTFEDSISSPSDVGIPTIEENSERDEDMSLS